jgi:hypothetical protein
MGIKLDSGGTIGNIFKETLLWTWENMTSLLNLRNIFIDICTKNISICRLHDHFTNIYRDFLHKLSI